MNPSGVFFLAVPCVHLPLNKKSPGHDKWVFLPHSSNGCPTKPFGKTTLQYYPLTDFGNFHFRPEKLDSEIPYLE